MSIENQLTFFVSGSHGFIGNAICAYLEEQNQKVIRYDRSARNFHPVINCDYIVHLGAYGNHYHQTDINSTIRANITDLTEMIEIAQQSKRLKQFYNISSSSVTLPVQTMYSASKMFGETIINSLKDERFVNVRPYSVYGPGEAAHRFIPTVIRCLKSGEVMQLDTEPVHDFIFITDFIEAMFAGATDIGTGNCHSNLQVVQMLEHISGKKLNFETKKLRVYDNYNWKSPTSVPHISIYEGLKKTYEQY